MDNINSKESRTGVEVGKKNLVRDGVFKDDLSYWTNWGDANKEIVTDAKGRNWVHIWKDDKNSFRGILQIIPSFKTDTYYTLSFYAKAKKGTSGGIRVLFHQSGDGNNNPQHREDFRLTNNKERYSFTFKSTNNNLKNEFNFMVGGEGGEPFDVYLTKIKFEESPIATPWTPAPEDITGNIDMNDYTTNREQLDNIIDLAIRDIVSVGDDEPPEIAEGFYANYKKIIDAIPTDTDIIERELADHKRKARIELNSFSNSNYRETEKQLLATYIQDGLQAVNEANSKQEVDNAVNQVVDLIVALPQKEYKDKEMYLNTSTHEMLDIQNGADPDLFDGESDYRLIQLYHNHFTGLTFPGTSRPQPSLKLFTMSKEEVE